MQERIESARELAKRNPLITLAGASYIASSALNLWRFLHVRSPSPTKPWDTLPERAPPAPQPESCIRIETWGEANVEIEVWTKRGNEVSF